MDGNYLKELVRYIHFNPLRAGLVGDLDGLDKHPFFLSSPFSLRA
jgi:hypothetical protein